MATKKLRVRSAAVWELVEKQHGVVTRSQLLGLGMSAAAIRHRLNRGRLHPLRTGVYAVGRPDVSERGRWMAAVLACGPAALLSHRSAAALLGLRGPMAGPVEVVVPVGLRKRRPGLRVHRRGDLNAGRHGSPWRPGDPDRLRWRLVDGIPTTAPAVVLIDLASCLATSGLEAAINEADHLDLIDPHSLRSALDDLPRRPGVRRLRTLLDRTSLALSSTVLEQRFCALVAAAGLPTPQTQSRLGHHRVDFFWPDLGLVVEADSLRYHRTTFKQSADTRRDNAHARVGRTTLRFTHGQVRYEPEYVTVELRAVMRRLQLERGRKLSPGRQ
jgi:very-short-patch-repair endonuclease